jgi:hypothetical protein
VTGRVVHVLVPDTTPAAGVWAVLHQITDQGGAVVDSARTDAQGRYAVRAPVQDSASVYVVSVTYGGIAYFSRPVRPSGRAVATAEVLAVFDTSSTAPAIVLAQRHVIIRRPEDRGSRRVLELLVLANTGDRTRVAPDTSRPVWQGRLPRGATGFEVGESDVSNEAVFRRGGAIAVAAPIPPGEKQILVSYILPADEPALALDVDQEIARLNVLVEDSAATVTGGPLAPMGVEEMEGIRFTRFAAEGIEPGTRVTVQFGERPFSPASLWWMVVVLAAATLAASMVPWWRRTRGAGVAAEEGALAAQLAAVEAALADRGSALSEPERQAYAQRRAALQRALEARRVRRPS